MKYGARSMNGVNEKGFLNEMEELNFLSLKHLTDFIKYEIPWDDLMENEPLFWFAFSIILAFIVFGLLGYIQHVYFKRQKSGLKYEEILLKRKGNKKLNYE